MIKNTRMRVFVDKTGEKEPLDIFTCWPEDTGDRMVWKSPTKSKLVLGSTQTPFLRVSTIYVLFCVAITENPAS